MDKFKGMIIRADIYKAQICSAHNLTQLQVN